MITSDENLNYSDAWKMNPAKCPMPPVETLERDDLIAIIGIYHDHQKSCMSAYDEYIQKIIDANNTYFEGIGKLVDDIAKLD